MFQVANQALRQLAAPFLIILAILFIATCLYWLFFVHGVDWFKHSSKRKNKSSSSECVMPSQLTNGLTNPDDESIRKEQK